MKVRIEIKSAHAEVEVGDETFRTLMADEDDAACEAAVREELVKMFPSLAISEIGDWQEAEERRADESKKIRKIVSVRVLSLAHYVVDRGPNGMFEARVRMVDGKVAAEWRPIVVSAEQARYGGFDPAGGWRPCSGEYVE